MNAKLRISLIACAICGATAIKSWASGGAVETMRDFQNASHSPNPPNFQLNTNVQLFVNRGDLAFKNGRYEEAASCFTSALQGQTPSDKKATAAIYSRRCAALLHLNRLDKAYADANAAIALDPGLFNPYVNRGLLYRLRGQLDNAMRDYNTAIQLNPGAVLAFNNRGIVYHRKGQYQRAIQDFNDAIRLDPNYANAYLNRGTSYQALRQFNRALADYTEAIRRDSRVENAHFNRGNLYFELGEYDRAIADLTEAIRRNGDQNAYALRAQAYHKKNQPEKPAR